MRVILQGLNNNWQKTHETCRNIFMSYAGIKLNNGW